MALKEFENRIKRPLKSVGEREMSPVQKQKSRPEYRGGFPLLSTPFQD
jgi:hypothetical protein